MSESKTRRRLDIALELLETIAKKKESNDTNVVLLRTSKGEWKALFDTPDLREAGSKGKTEEIPAFPTIEEALFNLIANPA